MTTAISLKQVPVIQYKQELAKIGESIDKRLKELNIDGQIATIDTIKSLKDTRADFNKELKEFEAQRTSIKKDILSPYDEFEKEYKTAIKEKIEKAVETLKDKIAFVEDDLRKKKIDGIKEYFEELKIAKSIDFLTFEQVGLEITLSTADKQYKEKCIEFVNKVVDDLELIDTQSNKTEILVEYKTSLNAARSIKTVQERKAAIELQEKQDKQEQLNKRIQIVESLGFIFNESTANYVKGEDLISYELIQQFSTDSFKHWAIEKAPVSEPVIEQNNPGVFDDGVIFIDTPKFSAPLLQTITYTITGTKTQIDNLDKFLKEYQIRNTKL